MDTFSKAAWELQTTTAVTANATQEYIDSNVIGISIALGINVLVCAVVILIFLLNRAFVLPILLCQSIYFTIRKKVTQRDAQNTFSILHISHHSIPKLFVMTLLVLFILLRCVTLCFRITQFAVYGRSWSVIDAIGSSLLVLGMALMVSIFSTFLLLWLQFIYSINKAHRILHPAGFILFLLLLLFSNLLCWMSAIAVSVAYCIPKDLVASISQFYFLAVGIPAGVYVASVIFVDIVMSSAGIAIIAMLVKSYQFQKKLVPQVEEDKTMSADLHTKMKQLLGLMIRFAVVIIALLFSINIIVVGLIIMAAGTRPWISVMFMQTIPESVAILAMCIFFVPFFKIPNYKNFFQRMIGTNEKENQVQYEVVDVHSLPQELEDATTQQASSLEQVVAMEAGELITISMETTSSNYAAENSEHSMPQTSE